MHLGQLCISLYLTIKLLHNKCSKRSIPTLKKRKNVWFRHLEQKVHEFDWVEYCSGLSTMS